MYVAIWNKYLPIIRILLKRAVNGEQVLDLNRIDFERAGSGRKAGYKFMIEFNKGRVGNIISGIPLAADLAQVMQEDAAAKAILLPNNFTISLNTKFKLTIVCTAVGEVLSEDKGAEVSDTTEAE
jgi:hypothetical protein